FTFAWRTPQTFTADLRDLFMAIQATLASVVASRRAYLAEEALRHHAETLAAVSTALSRASTEQDILTAVAGFAEQYKVNLSALSYTVVDAAGEPQGANVVALRAGNGQVIPVETLPSVYTARRVSPLLDLAFTYFEEPVVVENVNTDPRCNGPEV